MLLPRAHLPLRLFEPRYLAMLEDVLKTPERLIGMVQPQNDAGKLHRIGCAGRVVSFNEMQDGSYRITLRGISRFRVLEQLEGDTPYLQATVDFSAFSDDTGKAAPDHEFDREALLALLERYLSINKLSSDMDTLREADEAVLINSLAVLNPFSAEEKQALLEAPTLAKRRETLMMLMEFALNDTTRNGPMQ